MSEKGADGSGSIMVGSDSSSWLCIASLTPSRDVKVAAGLEGCVREEAEANVVDCTGETFRVKKDEVRFMPDLYEAVVAERTSTRSKRSGGCSPSELSGEGGMSWRSTATLDLILLKFLGMLGKGRKVVNEIT